MKKILFLSLLITLLGSCGKLPMNGKLDGMWQLTDIDYMQGESVAVKQERLYYSIQLHLISLRDANNKREYLGRFVHSKDSFFIKDFKTYGEEKIATKEELAPFGLDNTATYFKIEKLTKNKMILKSDFSRLYLRKF